MGDEGRKALQMKGPGQGFRPRAWSLDPHELMEVLAAPACTLDRTTGRYRPADQAAFQAAAICASCLPARERGTHAAFLVARKSRARRCDCCTTSRPARRASMCSAKLQAVERDPCALPGAAESRTARFLAYFKTRKVAPTRQGEIPADLGKPSRTGRANPLIRLVSNPARARRAAVATWSRFA